MSNAGDWIVVLYAGVGVGVLLIGAGLFAVCLRLAGLLGRATTTLDEVDRQLAALSPPILDALTHVGGIAGTADATLARLTTVVDAVEGIAGGVVKGANAAQNSVTPVITNVGATLTTLSSRLRRFVKTGKPAESVADINVDV